MYYCFRNNGPGWYSYDDRWHQELHQQGLQQQWGPNTFRIKNRSYDFTVDDEAEPAKVWDVINYHEAAEFKKRYPVDHPVSLQVICNYIATINLPIGVL